MIAGQSLTADSGPCRLAPVAEELYEQIHRTVDYPRLVPEAGCGVHEADELDDLVHAVEVAEGVLHLGEAIEHGVARRLVALLDGEVLAHDTGEIGLAVLHGRGAGEVEHVLHREVRGEARPRRVGRVVLLEIGHDQAQPQQLLLDDHFPGPPTQSPVLNSGGNTILASENGMSARVYWTRSMGGVHCCQ